MTDLDSTNDDPRPVLPGDMVRLIRTEDGLVTGLTMAPLDWQILGIFGDGYIESEVLHLGDRLEAAPAPEPELPPPIPTRDMAIGLLDELVIEYKARYTSQYPQTSIADLWPHLVQELDMLQRDGVKPYPSYGGLYGAYSVRVNIPVSSVTETQLTTFATQIRMAKARHVSYLQYLEVVYRAVLTQFEQDPTINIRAKWVQRWAEGGLFN